jgi:hypothetical protein
MNEHRTPDERVITVWIATDRVGSKMERKMKESAEDWNQMTEDEKAAAVWDFIMERSMIDWGWKE